MNTIFRKFIYFFLFVFPVRYAFPAYAQKQPFKTVKVIFWNIWNGFGSNPNKICLDDFVGFIQKENHDVLGWVEMSGYYQEKLTKLASRYGYPCVTILTGDNHLHCHIDEENIRIN